MYCILAVSYTHLDVYKRQVSGTVTFDFFDPIIRIISFFESQFQVFPVFAVEKFTITKNSDFIFSKYNIWRAGKGFVIFTVSVTFMP